MPPCPISTRSSRPPITRSAHRRRSWSSASVAAAASPRCAQAKANPSPSYWSRACSRDGTVSAATFLVARSTSSSASTAGERLRSSCTAPLTQLSRSSQAQHLEAALRAHGVDVAAHYYEGAGHNLDGDPAVGTDLEDQITQFVCARIACAPYGRRPGATRRVPRSKGARTRHTGYQNVDLAPVPPAQRDR